MAPNRVVAYIDGFNLYFGLKAKGWEKYLWLDVHGLAKDLLKPDQELKAIKYFTSRVSNDPAKQKRQSDFLEAILTVDDVKIFYGKFQINPRKCRACNTIDSVPNEKMTDVNIAVELLSDAFTNAFDTALLISADSDLVPPIRKVKALFPQKRIVVCFPPERFSTDLRNTAGITMTLGRAIFARNQFPDTVVKPDGYQLKRPVKWH